MRSRDAHKILNPQGTVLSTVITNKVLLSRRFLADASFPRLQRASGWINRNPGRAFLLLTIGYAGAVVALSCMKLLWLDELITLHIARLGSIAAIWHALAAGADPNPPLAHILVLACMRTFGEHTFVLRLPAMAGYWIGMLSLYLFLRRHVPAVWALAAVVMSMGMAAFEYSYESRSYGIFYGLTMLALYCWCCAADPASSSARRGAALAGMVLALTAAISTSYIAVLAFLPIAGGEVARTLQSIRDERWNPTRFKDAVQYRIWIALVLAATPLLAYRPLIQRSIAEFAPYAWNKVSLDQIADSYTEMVEFVLYALLALFVFAIVIRALSRFCVHCRGAIQPQWIGELATQQADAGSSTLPQPEAVAVFLLLAYPILGYIVASIHGGMLSPRFVIPVCFGFAIAGTLACFRIFGHMRVAGISLLLICIAWFGTRESIVGFWYMEQKQCFYKVLNRLPAGEFAGDPIVIPDPLMVLTFRYYAPPDLAARVVFPIDFPAIRLYRGEDSPEQNLWAGRNSIYHLPVVPLARFQRSAGKYLIVASDGNWLVQDLLHHRYPVKRLPINTRAVAIGGFTPLNHGTPVFYSSVGDRFFKTTPGFVLTPIRFRTIANLPSAKLGPAEGGPFEDPK